MVIRKQGCANTTLKIFMVIWVNIFLNKKKRKNKKNFKEEKEPPPAKRGICVNSSTTSKKKIGEKLKEKKTWKKALGVDVILKFDGLKFLLEAEFYLCELGMF